MSAKQIFDTIALTREENAAVPYTPEQNGATEASNQVILRKARSLLIDARMPPIFWPWAVEHACFLANRLYCLRTKKVLIVDFLHGLKQPHHDKVDFSCLPRFGCRAYKLINPKPGKFEARAEKGWFVGFPKNTSKNYLMYHPYWTNKQGWKWIESCTPHVTFHEDVVFGDKLNTFNQQKTVNYWTSENPLSVEAIQPTLQHPPQSNQTTNRFEGGIPSSSIRQQTEQQIDQPIIPPPSIPLELDEIVSQQAEQPAFPRQQENKTSSPPSPPSVPIITDDKWPQESTELIDLTNDKKSQQLPNVEDSSDDGSEYILSYLSVQSDYPDENENLERIESQ